MNQVGRNIAYSILSNEMYVETFNIIGPSPTSIKLALSSTSLRTPFIMARSMKIFIGAKGSVVDGATRKVADIETFSKGFSYVVESFQSNFTPWQFGGDELPDREACNTE
jgi:hypothetical protein